MKVTFILQFKFTFISKSSWKQSNFQNDFQKKLKYNPARPLKLFQFCFDFHLYFDIVLKSNLFFYF